MCGPSKSRKTSFSIRFLQILATLCTEREFGGGIIWCYNEKTAVPKRRLLPSKSIYHEGVPEKFGVGGRPCLVILDYFLNDVYSKKVGEWFTRGSHHRNINVILIKQNLLHQGRYCRDISLNAHYVVALKNASLCTCPIKCIPKVVLRYITPTWMRHKDITLTSS